MRPPWQIAKEDQFTAGARDLADFCAQLREQLLERGFKRGEAQAIVELWIRWALSQ